MKLINNPAPGAYAPTRWGQESQIVNRTELPGQLLERLVRLAGGLPRLNWTLIVSTTKHAKSHGMCDFGRRRVTICLPYARAEYATNPKQGAWQIYRIFRHELFHVHDPLPTSVELTPAGKRRPKWETRPEEIRARAAENAPLSEAEDVLLAEIREWVKAWHKKAKPCKPRKPRKTRDEIRRELESDPRVESVSVGYDGDWWVYFRPGFIDPEYESHFSHEFSVRDIRTAFKRIVACDCDECACSRKKATA